MKVKGKSKKVKVYGKRKKFLNFCLFIFTFTFFLLPFSLTCYAFSLDSIKVSILQGDYKQAIKEGEKLIALEPHSEELYYFLGISYLKDGNYLRASDIFEIILSEFSSGKFKEEALLGLGDTYFLRGDIQKAESLYRELLNKYPSSQLKAAAYFRLSKLYFGKGDTAQGEEFLEKLKNNYPLNPEIRSEVDFCPLPKAGQEGEFYYSVQVGAFANPANAANFTQKLINEGYPAFVEESAVAGNASFRVRAGKFKSRAEAEALEQKLAQAGYPTKICP